MSGILRNARHRFGRSRHLRSERGRIFRRIIGTRGDGGARGRTGQLHSRAACFLSRARGRRRSLALRGGREGDLNRNQVRRRYPAVVVGIRSGAGFHSEQLTGNRRRRQRHTALLRPNRQRRQHEQHRRASGTKPGTPLQSSSSAHSPHILPAGGAWTRYGVTFEPTFADPGFRLS